ncbi:hypothetical protein N7516_000468 [Penicillium verrucosum]|uniref:uncharacterized protein n=1 Tax=Penicillium verrucosum TaxID=60171 RepID=UPI002544D982|nr:uncharacterized protein N7516_000468 [Penicillium verrucosum]KAJ5940300.1 hypothetical protein N7516_000468 [Penicillium verrucosum]
MTMADKDDLGMKKNNAGSAYIARGTKTAVITLARGVRTPHFALIAVRDNEPVAGYAPKNRPSRFEMSMAMNSYDGSIV